MVIYLIGYLIGWAYICYLIGIYIFYLIGFGFCYLQLSLQW